MPQLQQHAWPEGTLPAILERFMWVSTIDPVTTVDQSWHEVHLLRIAGIVKAPEDVTALDATKTEAQETVDIAARSVRESLLRQAEDAIAAAREAGFALYEHPDISIGGTLRHDRESGLDIPVAEVTVTLWFRAARSGPDQLPDGYLK